MALLSRWKKLRADAHTGG